MSPATRGEIWLADLGPTRDDHELLGRRPVVVFQDDCLLRLNTVVVIPLTTQLGRADYRHNVLIPAGEADQDCDSVAQCHQLRAINRRKLIHKIGELTPERLTEVELSVMFVLGLPS
jgi:mRNA interferase MazF